MEIDRSSSPGFPASAGIDGCLCEASTFKFQIGATAEGHTLVDIAHLDEPLQGKVRFDRGFCSIGMSDLDDACFYLLEQPSSLEATDHFLSCLESIVARARSSVFIECSVRVEDVDQVPGVLQWRVSQ